MYDIILFKGTTSMPVIGKDCETVRKMVHKPCRHIEGNIENMDIYDGFNIIYSKNNICVALEIFNDEEIYYKNHQLIGLTRKEAALLIKKLHPDCIPTNWEKDDTDYIMYLDLELSIGLNCETRRVGYVLIGREGYFKESDSIHEPIDIDSITN